MTTMLELQWFLLLLPLFLYSVPVSAQTRDDNCPTADAACTCYDHRIICADLGHLEVLPTFRPSRRTFSSLSFQSDSCRILGVQSRAFAGLRIRSIDLTSLDLGSLDQGAFSGTDIPALGSISLAHNNLRTLPSSAFAGLTSLSVLDLRSNYLSQLRRDTFASLGSSLRTLLLSENHFRTRGLENGMLNDLGRLRRLQIEDNQLTRWSSRILVGTTSISELSLAGNRFTTLPKGSLDGLSQLMKVRLSRNSIATLAGGTFRRLTSLRELDLADNRLKRLNETVFEGLNSLLSLNLSANELTGLEEDVLLPLIGLRSLDLSQNLIRRLPDGSFANLTTLVTLDLSGNNLTINNETLRGLTSLTELYLSSNSICTISSSLFADLSQLRVLDLSDNKIRHIEAGFLSFSPALKAINLSGNELSEIQPNVFLNGPKLKGIDLSWNTIRRINRDTFYNLLLTHVDLSHNEIEFVHPDAFQHIASLSTVVLNHNRLHHVPSTLLYNIAVLQNVDLDYNLIETLPPRAFEGLYVERLSLIGNRIRFVDGAAFAGLLKTRSIDLSDNQIQHIPGDTFNHFPMSFVLYLSLSNNNLTQLSSDTFAGLPGLAFLDLSNNRINTIADGSFSALQRLRELRLGGNRLESIRYSWIGDIGTLRSLNLSSNGISNRALPAVRGLSGLTELHLDSNELTSLATLSGITLLRTLSVRNNSLTTIDYNDGFSVSALDVGHNRLRADALTFGLRSYLNLESLVLDGNRLGVIQSHVFTPFAYRLKELDLSDNGLDSTSLAALTDLVNIHTLTLDDNQLQDISLLGQTAITTVLHKMSAKRNRLNSTVFYAVSNFTKLSTLLLDGNVIDSIPDRTFDSTYNVQVLSLRKNIIRSMSSDALYGLHHTCLHLDLSDNRISQVTRQTFSSLRTLEYLDLSDNNLTSVNLSPIMPQLRVLRVGGNRLESFPGGLRRISQVSTVNVSHNSLTSLPAVAILGRTKDRVALVDFHGNYLLNLGELHLVGSFRRVDFSENSLTDLSPRTAIKRVKYADELDLSRNNITAISPAIWQATSATSSLNLSRNNLLSSVSNRLLTKEEQCGTILTKLDLSFNSLSEFPSSQIASLSSSLSVLDIRSNRFGSLPHSEFSNMTKFTHLFLAENLWNCSNCDLVSWIRYLQPKGIFVDNAKCMFPDSIRDQLVVCDTPAENCQFNNSTNDVRCYDTANATTTSLSAGLITTQPHRTADKSRASVTASISQVLTSTEGLDFHATTSVPFASSSNGTSLLTSYGVTTNTLSSTPYTTLNQEETTEPSVRVTAAIPIPSPSGTSSSQTAALTVTTLSTGPEKSTKASTASSRKAHTPAVILPSAISPTSRETLTSTNFLTATTAFQPSTSTKASTSSPSKAQTPAVLLPSASTSRETLTSTNFLTATTAFQPSTSTKASTSSPSKAQTPAVLLPSASTSRETLTSTNFLTATTQLHYSTTHKSTASVRFTSSRVESSTISKIVTASATLPSVSNGIPVRTEKRTSAPAGTSFTALSSAFTSHSSVSTAFQSSTLSPNTTVKRTSTKTLASIKTPIFRIPPTTTLQSFISSSSTTATLRITPGLPTHLPKTPGARLTIKPTPPLNDAIKKAKGVKKAKDD